MNFKFLTAAPIAVVFAVAACGSGNPSGSAPSAQPTAAPTTAPASPQAAGATVTTGNTRLGTVIVDSKGLTLYDFRADQGTTSACTSAACVQAWPPLITTGAPQAGAGVTASLLGTTKRADGTTEVTYAGHPLYYFIGDKKPGDVTGQAINNFGGPWYVLAPSGAEITSS